MPFQKYHFLILRARLIVLSSSHPVDRRIWAIPSDGSLEFRTAPDAGTLATDIVRMVTLGLGHTSIFHCVGRPLAKTTTIPYVTSPSLLRHRHVSITSALDRPLLRPVCHVSGPPRPNHRPPRHHSVPDPTCDVTLTSSEKHAKRPNFHI